MHRPIAAFLLLVAFCAPVALAQDLEERVRLLEEQNRQLIEQNKRLVESQNQVIERLRTSEQRNVELGRRMDERAAFEDRRLEGVLDEMGAMIDGLGAGAGAGGYRAASAGGNLSRAGVQLQFYGRVRLDAFFNTARMNRAVDAQWVRPEDGINASEDDESFVMSARLTTLGLNLDGGEIAGARARGKIEMDFADFQSESETRASARILTAYVDLDWGDFSVRLGQDWDVISPYDPTTDGFRHLWDTGNLGDRRPMIQAAWRGGAPRGLQFELRGAIGLTGSVQELQNGDADVGFGTFISTERDGFDSGLPHAQLAGSVSLGSWVSGQRITIGVSGLLGRLETDTRFNGEDDFTIWMVGLDFFIPLLDDLHLRGEAFLGSALGDFRGGIGQNINTITGDEIDSQGGWAELFWQVTDGFGLAVGGAIDNPNLQDLQVAMRASNWTLYVATRFDLGDGLTMGLDAMFWTTEYVLRAQGDTWRFNYFVQFAF